MHKRFFQISRLFQLSFFEEIRRIKKDSGALLILVFAVIFYPIVYSVAYKNNVLRDVPIALVDLDQTQLSRKTAQMIDATPQVNITTGMHSLKEAENAFWNGEVSGIILLQNGYEKAIYNGESAHVGVYCDASYFLIYKQTLTASLQATGTLSAGIEITRLLASGLNTEQAYKARNPLSLTTYNLFNPTSGYGNYIMPGMILIILQQTLLISIGLIGGSRHEGGKKLGVLQLAKDIAFWPIVLGRAFAYLLISAFNLVVTLVWIYHWFDFPDVGSFIHSTFILIPFLLSTIFFGIAVSNLFVRREHSIMFLVFLSPVVLFLSGLSWPIYAMPKTLYWIAHVFPSSFAIPAYLRIRTMGVALQNIQFEQVGLIIQSLFYFMLSVITIRLKYKRNFKKSAKAVEAVK